MWATYSKALWENHMIFHLCVVAFHQFTRSSLPTLGELACERARARAQGPVFLFPLLPLLRNIRTKVTRKTWDPEKPEFSCSFFSRSENHHHGCFQLELLVFCLLWFHLGLPRNGFDSHSYCDFVVCLDESGEVNISFYNFTLQKTKNSWKFVYILAPSLIIRRKRKIVIQQRWTFQSKIKKVSKWSISIWTYLYLDTFFIKYLKSICI